MDRWVAWHEAYDVAGSALGRRLSLVARHIRQAVEALPPGEVRLVSLCAGQGHDVVRALAGHPRRGDVRGGLVELNPTNAGIARERIAGAGLDGLRVVEADAGDTGNYAEFVPADVVLVCGVFGNIGEEDIRRTVLALPELAAPGATVVWTRHRREPDVTGRIREWFAEGGFREVAFDAPPEHEIGVGVHQLVGPPRPRTTQRLFSFPG
ncbi:SAM-dependent methyltransferase [Dactylosporangium salmoneum]|uniref:SAM-dependent methyltransferase n=1 Tax=Dactylosporangium salmoneum TaxID=53361 RepID=A0ABP5S9L7_9ACTN